MSSLRMAGQLAAAAIVIVPLVIFAGLALSPGIVVQGVVIDKQESFEMPAEDVWRHVFEVRYRYRPHDSQRDETASHPVDSALYSRLQIGSRVPVRYNPFRVVRPMRGVGSALVDSTWLSRMPVRSEEARQSGEIAAFVFVAVLGFLAYRRNSRPLGMLAGFAAATLFSSVLLMGCFVFPLVFWMWRRNRGKGFGWLLLGSMVLSTVVLYWRIPWPAPETSGPRDSAAAVVRRVQTVSQVWNSHSSSDGSSGGQSIRQPFQMADLEFTPAGASESVHVLDRVDLNSVPGLRDGARVQVSYPVSDPRAGRIAGGTRTYARQTLGYFLGLTYGIGAVLAFVIFPVIFFVGKVFDSFPVLKTIEADDPRRTKLEEILRRGRESN